MDLIFIDTETTGFGDCRLVELAWGRATGEISAIRVKPPIPISEEAVRVHGITEESLKDSLAFLQHPEYNALKELFESNCIVMHNADFDRAVLEREGIRISNFICTKRVSRRLYPSLKSHRLQDLREQFYFNTEAVAHSAGGDVATLIELFKKMQNDLQAGVLPTESAIAQMARLSIH